MASLIKEVRRGATTVRWVAFTLLGAAINSAFWSQYLFFSPHILATVTDYVSLSLFYMLIIVVFSLATSLLLPEKRIVSPNDIQLISFSFIIITGYLNLHGPLLDYSLVMIFSFLLLYFAGLIQNKIVTWIIGIYGTREDCWFGSYSADLAVDDLTKKLRDKSFSKATEMVRRTKIKSGIRVFRNLSGEGYQVFIFLKPHPDPNAQVCLVNVVAYERTRYGIMNSQICEHKTEMITCLMSKLFKSKKAPKEDDFYEQSILYALRPTRNKLEFKRISMRITLACLVAIFIVAPLVMFRLSYLPTLESVAAIEIPAVLAILLQFAPRSKE